MGQKDPLDDKETTHGICLACDEKISKGETTPGLKPKPKAATCPDCNGEGNRQEPCTRCRSYGGRDCAACGNAGFVDLGPCIRCRQSGQVDAEDLTDEERADLEDKS